MSLLPPFTRSLRPPKSQARAGPSGTRAPPPKVALAYTPDTIWRNRTSSCASLEAKWNKEHHYVLRKDLFSFTDDKIAVQFFYEWNDAPDGKGQWYRTYGLEGLDIRPLRPHAQRMMSGNDLPIVPEERWFTEGVERR
ncbi:hypothetical protein B0H14DRAFT_2709841 [Mycena olivaceomarginata]|nr:hypothetical protein B0H14DRAFT_2709841 [Mycena olivaceomarginata]